MQSLILLLPDELSVVPPFLQQTWTNALLSSIHGGLSQSNIKAQTSKSKQKSSKSNFFYKTWSNLQPCNNKGTLSVGQNSWLILQRQRGTQYHCRRPLVSQLCQVSQPFQPQLSQALSQPGVPGSRCCGQRCVPWFVSKQFWVTQLTKPGLFINFHFTHFSIHHKTKY